MRTLSWYLIWAAPIIQLAMAATNRFHTWQRC